MNTKKLVLCSLLVAMGTVLHAIVPGVFFGMKPDMLLTMMFIGIILFPDKQTVILLGLTTGIMSAMTTNFPSGQIPNLIDKPITAFVFFGLIVLAKRMKNQYVKAILLTAIGTIVSGFIFLSSAMVIVELPGGASFVALFLTVVLPTTAINSFVMSIIYPVFMKVTKRMKFA